MLNEKIYRRFGDLRMNTHFKYHGKSWTKVGPTQYRELGIPDLSNKVMAKRQKIRFEDAPTCSMGMSSAVHGTGAIDTYDPLLRQRRKKLRSFMNVTRRTKPSS